MARSGEDSELAGTLATVAIASLGGPLAAVGAALAEVVKLAQARYEANAPTRDLRRQVTAGIRKWADGEKLSLEDVRLGLALATETVARFGLDYEEIAGLNFDPQGTSEKVLRAAKASDKRWGTEHHYEVAARGIAETYCVLIHQFRASEKVLLPAVQVLRGRIDEYAARAETLGRSTQVTLGDLAAALVAAGTVAEVMAYLRTRIADWDVSVWHPGQQAQSALERRLRVRTIGEPSAGDRALTAEEALAGQRMLVVLGGPGSGKTWLARRYARKAAQAALLSLEDGADLDEVELPLFTTWDQWTKTAGGTRQALVAASFASGLGHSDSDAGDAIGRLRRTFTQPGRKVLLVVDSLDEAADLAGQASRLRELTLLHGWRFVVTSRPAAWDATYRGEPSHSDGLRVVALQDFEYPDDVERFTRAWFAADPSRGDALIKQIQARDDLARIAVIPLMLTFYCLLSEEPADAARPLPARRRDLYRRLVRRLLRSMWATNVPGPDAAPDMPYSEALLTQWGWHAVHNRTTPAGLGNWGDSFTQPFPPRPGQGRAIDHVAPKVAENDEGKITRRFVHRTVLEHFVAEHIAAMDPNEAAHILLPHLWFDPDWKGTAPAAIAAHNHRHQGDLLQQLLAQAAHPATDPARQAVSSEFDRLLLAIAEESEPGDWTPEHQDMFHKCRERNATGEPTAVARTAHWTGSNQGVRTAVLAALPSANPHTVRGLVTLLRAVVTTDVDRAEARTAVLATLPTADPDIVLDLVVTLLALDPPGDVDRAEARTAVLAAVVTARPWYVRALVMLLRALVTTDVDRAEAHTAVLAALPTAEPRNVGGLVTLLPDLVTSDVDRAEARTAVVAALPTADPDIVLDLVATLLALDPGDVDRAEARTAVLAALPTADPWNANGLVLKLPDLVTSEIERAKARTAVLAALPTTEPRNANALVVALLLLHATDADRAEARSALLAALPFAEPENVRSLVTALPALVTSDADRAEVRTAVLAALSTADPQAVLALVEALPDLVTTDADRARTAVLAALPSADPGNVGGLVAELPALDPTDAGLARTALLAALPTADPHTLRGLVAALPALVTSVVDRAEARTAVLAALPSADPWAVRGLLEALPALVTSDVDRAEARTAVLAALSTANPENVGGLVAALPDLDPTDVDRAEARTAVLAALSTAKPHTVRDLVAALPALVTSDVDRDEARTAVLAALSTAKPHTVRDLVAAVRSISSCQSWLAWLANSE